MHPADAAVGPSFMRHLVALPILIVASTTIVGGQRRQGPSTERVSLAASVLAAHNAVRQEAGVPELNWSVELATFAQQWADAGSTRPIRPPP